MAKKKITYTPQVNYYVLAIATTLEDYRLPYFINEKLNISLTKIDDLSFSDKNNSKAKKHSQFYTIDEEHDYEFFLVQNKLSDNILIKSLKNFDYLFILKTIDSTETIDINTFSNKMKRIEGVQLIFNANKLSKSETNYIAKLF